MSSATSAYRQDARRNGGPFGAHDSEWIVAVTIAEQAAMAEGERRVVLLDEAAREAARVLGEATRTRLAFREWNEPGTDVGTLTLLSAHLHELGALALSTCLVEAALIALDQGDPLERGRMLAQLGRNAYVASELDLADDFYAQVEAIGTRINSVELRARAAHGMMALAQVRGNYPKHAEIAPRALELSDAAGIPTLRRNARYASLRDAVARKDWEQALLFGWELVDMARGDSELEARALHNMGVLALEMGDRVTARSALRAVVARQLPVKIHLAALGSLAIVSAGHADETPILDWAVSEVVRLRDSVAPRFAFVQALLECAIALRADGRIEEARSFRDEASALARVYGFNELLYRADEMEEIGRLADRVHGDARADVDAPAFSTGRSGEIVSSVRELEPAQLPLHVDVAAPALV